MRSEASEVSKCIWYAVKGLQKRPASAEVATSPSCRGVHGLGREQRQLLLRSGLQSCFGACHSHHYGDAGGVPADHRSAGSVRRSCFGSESSFSFRCSGVKRNAACPLVDKGESLERVATHHNR